MSTRRHPSKRRLQQWLAGDESRRVDRHVAECEECQAALEELSSLDAALVADLGEALAPPDNLTGRTADGVQERLRDEAAFAAFVDLFTVGWDVARTIMDPDCEIETQVQSNDATDGDGAQVVDAEADVDGGGRS